MKETMLISLLILSAVAVARPERGLESHMQRLERALALTPAQKPKVREILEAQREKMRAIRRETRQRLKKVLTAEQWRKLQAMHRRRMERWKGRLPERTRPTP